MNEIIFKAMINTRIEHQLDVLCSDTPLTYVIEKINENYLKIYNQTISIDRLKNKHEIVTVDYHNCMMKGFQFQLQSKKLQYRWFSYNTSSKLLQNGSWNYIFT